MLLVLNSLMPYFMNIMVYLVNKDYLFIKGIIHYISLYDVYLFNTL